MNILEADLNDIDEFIQAEKGFQPLGSEASLVGTSNEILNTSPLCKGTILIVIIIPANTILSLGKSRSGTKNRNLKTPSFYDFGSGVPDLEFSPFLNENPWRNGFLLD